MLTSWRSLKLWIAGGRKAGRMSTRVGHRPDEHLDLGLLPYRRHGRRGDKARADQRPSGVRIPQFADLAAGEAESRSSPGQAVVLAPSRHQPTKRGVRAHLHHEDVGAPLRVGHHTPAHRPGAGGPWGAGRCLRGPSPSRGPRRQTMRQQVRRRRHGRGCGLAGVLLQEPVVVVILRSALARGVVQDGGAPGHVARGARRAWHALPLPLRVGVMEHRLHRSLRRQPPPLPQSSLPLRRHRGHCCSSRPLR
mmetsp:Transcript_82278/g.209115  ORF Transcript_82278/g.209115 Transcript_82278/m.209115 type:complete len:250 (-) Transcript_82278:349-1098(-)